MQRIFEHLFLKIILYHNWCVCVDSPFSFLFFSNVFFSNDFFSVNCIDKLYNHEHTKRKWLLALIHYAFFIGSDYVRACDDEAHTHGDVVWWKTLKWKIQLRSRVHRLISTIGKNCHIAIVEYRSSIVMADNAVFIRIHGFGLMNTFRVREWMTGPVNYSGEGLALSQRITNICEHIFFSVGLVFSYSVEFPSRFFLCYSAQKCYYFNCLRFCFCRHSHINICTSRVCVCYSSSWVNQSNAGEGVWRRELDNNRPCI